MALTPRSHMPGANSRIPSSHPAHSAPGRSRFGGSAGIGVGVSVGGSHIFSSGLNEVTVGLMALKGALSLVETGFNTLAKTTNDLVGAIAQLGGARGLQQMFVESVTNQQLVNQARFSVSGDERMTSRELQNLTKSLSEQGGGKTQAEWLGAIKEISTITGKQSSFSPETLKFLDKMSVVTGSSLGEQASVFGKLQMQHPNLSEDKVVESMLSLHAIGQKGSFNMTEFANADRLLRAGNMFGGDDQSSIALLGTVGTLLKSGTGANLQQTGAMLKSFISQAHKSGSSLFHFDKNTGQMDNAEQSLIDIVNTPYSELNSKLKIDRSNDAVVGLRKSVSDRAGVKDDDQSQTAQEARARVIRDFDMLGMTMESFNKEFLQSLTPAENFRVQFNRIADELEGKFYNTLMKAEPTVEAFADVIINHKDDIGKYFDQLAIWLGVAVQKFPAFMDVMAGLATAVGNAAEWILEHTTGVGPKDVDDRIKATQDRIKAGVSYAIDDPDHVHPIPMKPDELEDLTKHLQDLQSYKRMFAGEKQLSSGAISASAQQQEDEQAQSRAADKESNIGFIKWAPGKKSKMQGHAGNETMGAAESVSDLLHKAGYSTSYVDALHSHKKALDANTKATSHNTKVTSQSNSGSNASKDGR